MKRFKKIDETTDKKSVERLVIDDFSDTLRLELSELLGGLGVDAYYLEDVPFPCGLHRGNLLVLSRKFDETSYGGGVSQWQLNNALLALNAVQTIDESGAVHLYGHDNTNNEIEAAKRELIPYRFYEGNPYEMHTPILTVHNQTFNGFPSMGEGDVKRPSIGVFGHVANSIEMTFQLWNDNSARYEPVLEFYSDGRVVAQNIDILLELQSKASQSYVDGNFATKTELTDGLATKSDTGHGHEIADVDLLQAALDAIAAELALKSDKGHEHELAEIIGLLTELANLANDIASKAALIHSHAITDVTDLQLNLDSINLSLNSKANAVHAHAISDVTDLAAQLLAITNELAEKALATHTHVASDVTDLAGLLDGKSNVGHGHAISEITDLANQLAALLNLISGKSDLGHTHATSEITGLDATLANKSDVGHGHAMSEIAGLLTQLTDLASAIGGKAEAIHTHTAAAITDLQALLDAKSDVGHGHDIADIDDLQTELNSKALSSVVTELAGQVDGLVGAVTAMGETVTRHDADITDHESRIDALESATPAGVVEYYARESADKIFPQGGADVAPMLVCTIPETGTYEIEAFAYFVEFAPYGGAIDAHIVTNPLVSIYGERGYFSGAATYENVDCWAAPNAQVAISAISYKSYANDRSQRVRLKGVATLNANTTVTLTYSRSDNTIGAKLFAGSWARVRKIG